MVHVPTLFVKPIKVHLNCKVQIAALIANKTLITVLAEYPDFADIFSKNSAVVLLEHIEINTNTIDWEEDK